MTQPQTSTDIDKLLALIRRLRAPDGCPWDREQTLTDLRSYLLEEAHEVAAALDSGDFDELAGELGDLLFQVGFVSVLAEEQEAFRLQGVIDRVHAKMVERHPHVFGDAETPSSASEMATAWERSKVERQPERASLLDGVAKSLPELVAAYRLTQKAAGVGFDWPDASHVLAKLDEEARELAEVMEQPAGAIDRERLASEVGDLLFTAVNLARKLDVDPGSALARTNLKFRRRFQHIERRLRQQGRTVNDAGLEEMEALWVEAKNEVESAG